MVDDARLVALEAANEAGRVVVAWPGSTVEALVAAKLVALAPGSTVARDVARAPIERPALW